MIELLNKISNLSFHGFYDPSKDKITVHFFNETEKKNDIIAFLNRNMTWDVREIVKESSELFDDKEVIIIDHLKICTCEHNGDFDKFVRKGLIEMSKQIEEGGINYFNTDIMLKILEYNNYNIINKEVN